MNRNNEAHFNEIPKTYISRSRFKRDQDIKLTFDAGELIPFYVDEVLPGDTFSVDTAGIVRMTTPIFPVMDNSYLDIYYFFVPNRIVWDQWKEFCGENTKKAWRNTETYTVPQITPGTGEDSKIHEGSALDYMGVPTKVNIPSDGINALPIRGYVKIWNEWFRDQNVDDPAVLSTTSSNTAYKTPGDSDSQTVKNNAAQTGSYLLKVNKFHDYFTSALPEPQKGPDVKMTLAGAAPVIIGNKKNIDSNDGIWTTLRSNWTKGAIRGDSNAYESAGNDMGKYGVKLISVSGEEWDTSGETRLQANLTDVTAVSINKIRNAIAVQHYYEAMARGGSRYREIIRSMFGTLISDKTVQIPEYLGGGRYPINMSQVVQTSSTTENSPQGNVAAISVTPFSANSFTKSFEEHGFVIGVLCVRHDRTYQQGLERMWSRKDTLDYYYPQFANIGEQAIKLKELYMQGTDTDNEAFGYQEAWAEYRMKPNRVCGKFRSNATGTLDSWHYADNYSARPYLSDEWMKEGKTEIQRTLAVQDEPQFIADILVKNNTTRPMPLYSVPGLEKL